MKLNEIFQRDEFVVTAEVGPVKGTIPRDNRMIPSCIEEAEGLKDWVHAINVTDNQIAVMKL